MGGFEKQFSGSKGHAQIIVDTEKTGCFEYSMRKEILKVKLHYGYWNSYGISQHC